MPNINLQTNLTLDKATAEELKAMLGKAIETLPGKTEEWLMVELTGDVNMCFGGKNDPCALVHVELLGKATEGVYAKMTALLTEKLSAKLGIAPDRIYVKYSEYPLWGWNGINL